MAYTINIADQSDAPQPVEALGHALRAVRIAEILGIDHDNKPEISRVLGEVLGTTYVIHGPKEYGGAIKGHALLGYVEYHAGAALAALETLPPAEQNEARMEFLAAHAFRGTVTDNILAQVDLAQVAIWRAFKDKAIIAPTSGSFGLAAYATIDRLRKASFRIDGQEFPLLQETEGHARAWVPDRSTEIMSEEKTAVIENIAADLGNQEIKTWTERNTRDHFAMLDALAHGDYFCPTNPKNREEIADILREMLENSYQGSPIFPEHSAEFSALEDFRERLERRDQRAVEVLTAMGVEPVYEGTALTALNVTETLSAGRYGLMIPRLRHIEEMLANLEISGDTTYNQPAIGATFAGAVDVDAILRDITRGNIDLSPENAELMQRHFPRIYKAVARDKALPELSLAIAPDICNTTLAAELNLEFDRTIKHNSNPENGVGSITAGKESLDVIRAHAESGNTRIQQRCTPATKPWIAVAQALLYLHEVDRQGEAGKFPEPAGAVSLACALKERYEDKTLTSDTLVYTLRKYGVTQEIFEDMLQLRFPHQGTNAWKMVEEEAKTHGPQDVRFLAALKASFAKAPDELEPLGVIPSSHSVTLYNTGSNGTEKFQVLAPQVIAAQEAFGRQQKRGKKHVVIVGGGVMGMQSAKHLMDTGYEVTVVDAAGVGQETSAGHPGMWSFFSAYGFPEGVLDKTIAEGGWLGDHLIRSGTGMTEAWKAKATAFQNDEEYRREVLEARVSLASQGMRHQRDHMQNDPGLQASEFHYDEAGSARWYYTKEGAAADKERLSDLLIPTGANVAQVEEPLHIDGLVHKNVFPGGAFNTQAYCVAQKAHLESRGMRVLEGVRVEDFLQENGKCRGIRTADGREIKADAVVLATGAAPDLLQKANPAVAEAMVPLSGLSINCILTAEQAQTYEARNLPKAFQVIDEKGRFINIGLLERPDGGRELRVAGMFLLGKPLKPDIQWEPAESIMTEWAHKFIPDLQQSQMNIWIGERSMTPDMMPIVGQDNQLPGLFYNIGQNTSGTSLGTGSALELTKGISQALKPSQGRKTSADNSYISADRFGEQIAVEKKRFR